MLFQSIDLSGCHGISSLRLLSQLPLEALASQGLQELHLTHSAAVTDDFVLLMCHCEPLATRLRVLELSSCQALTDRALVAVCNHLTSLEQLAFAWNKNITDFGLLGLPVTSSTAPASLQDTCKCCRHQQPATIDGTWQEPAAVGITFPEYHRPVDIGPTFHVPAIHELKARQKEIEGG